MQYWIQFPWGRCCPNNCVLVEEMAPHRGSDVPRSFAHWAHCFSSCCTTVIVLPELIVHVNGQFNIPCCHFLDFITSKNLCFSTQSQPPITLDSKIPPLNMVANFLSWALSILILNIPTLRILLPFKSWASLVAPWKRICLPMWEIWVFPWVRKIHWQKKWQPASIFLSGKSLGHGLTTKQ